MKSKIAYRVWQFWKSFQGTPGEQDWEKIDEILNSAERDLFKQLPIPDQNHSLRVLNTLESEGESDLDLLKAALLHDIGKARHPLRRMERIFAVLVNGFFPILAVEWGQKEPQGIYRALAVICQHPDWGADLAQAAGSNPTVVWLIRHHELEDLTGLLDQGGLELLQKLCKADNLN
jgi:putative nucleotidyltransferase with HDIG domain